MDRYPSNAGRLVEREVEHIGDDVRDFRIKVRGRRRQVWSPVDLYHPTIFTYLQSLSNGCRYRQCIDI
jgi:hypothetical protein